MLNKSSGGCGDTDQQERQMECYRIRRLVEVSPLQYCQCTGSPAGG